MRPAWEDAFVVPSVEHDIHQRVVAAQDPMA
jgi:hypothetical protein